MSPTMRQHHVAGERAFVDYAGYMVEVVDGKDRRGQGGAGVRRRARRPYYTYVEATWTQALPDWIGAHVRMLGFFAVSGSRWSRTT